MVAGTKCWQGTFFWLFVASSLAGTQQGDARGFWGVSPEIFFTHLPRARSFVKLERA